MTGGTMGPINPLSTGDLGYGRHRETNAADPRNAYSTRDQFAQAMLAYQAHLAQQQSRQAGIAGLARAIADPPPKPEDEFQVGEIIGYRCWKLKYGLLKSVSVDTVWHPGQDMTGNLTWGRMAGVHAFKTLEALMDQYCSYDSMADPYIYGTVEMWGMVDEYDYGYRAENAAIRSLNVIGAGRPEVVKIWRFWGSHTCPERNARIAAYDKKLSDLQELYGVAEAAE